MNEFRKQIDRIDNEMLELLRERMEVVRKIAEHKKEHKLPVFDPAREQEKLSSVDSPYEKKLYSVLFEISRDEQRGVLKSDCPDINNNKRLLVINGPNLNMLGIREPELYGNQTYEDLLEFIQATAREEGVECSCVQSNHEGVIVDKIHSAVGRFHGIIINPAAFTHTSIAILDALKTVNIPTVEVHLTDVQNREDFRKISYTGMVCEKTFAGMGFQGYAQAIKSFGGNK